MPEQQDITRVRHILREELSQLGQEYGVATLSLFGSRVRHEARPDSDLDILVEFHTTPGLLRLVELENHLSDLVGIRVDLVMAQALKPHIGHRILEEVMPVWKTVKEDLPPLLPMIESMIDKTL